MNGWFIIILIENGNNNIKFPIKNNNIIPIYISTCLSKDVPLLYKKECIEHYKKIHLYCRDKTTLNLLKNEGVDANLYGCLTQLSDIKNVPNNNSYEEKYKDSIIYIDCPNKWKERNINEKNYYFNHYIQELMNMNPKQRINYAQDLLTKYKYAKKYILIDYTLFYPVAMGLDVEYVVI